MSVSRKPLRASLDFPVLMSGVSMKRVEKFELQVMTDLEVRETQFI